MESDSGQMHDLMIRWLLSLDIGMESNSGLIIILGRAIISFPEILYTKMVSGLPPNPPLINYNFPDDL